ncbi:MAG: tetratricopeptide repeat protein [Fibrobacter sp.]|nr:tetratricopeptide repeat protein [Fibrobacter sp.]
MNLLKKLPQNTNYLKSLISVFFVMGVLFQGLKADGLPGEYILSDQWRALFKYHSPLTNPAFMMENTYISVRGVAAITQSEVSKLWEAGIIVPVGFYHALGFGVVAENGQTVVNTITRDSIQKSNNNNYLFTLSYAINPWRRLNAGVNLNMAYQSNFGQDPSIGIGADLGLTYRILFHPVWGYHILGVTFQNLISPQLAVDEKMPYSSEIKGFYRSTFLQNRLEFNLQYNLTDFLTKAEKFLDNSKSLEWTFSVQGGFWILPFFAIRGFTDFGDTKKLEYWGAACELNVPQVNGGRDFSVTYQFRDQLEGSLRGSQSLYLRVDIGANREERRIRKTARFASLNANELYTRALTLYHKGNYWDAFFTFRRLTVEYPDFYKNDIAEYHAGSCLEKLDLREEAIKAYTNVKTNYPMSSATAMADLGLMRVHYRKEDYPKAADQYTELNKPSVSDSLRQHGCYLMGETDLARKEYSRALRYFALVPENHPDYVFAQISTATAHALLDSDTRLIVTALENCISADAKTKEQKEVINRAYLLLGYIFYEDNALSKAVTALREIPKDSYHYEDAQLGLGWTAIKARQWKDCIDAGVNLAQSTRKFILQCEAALLQGYGYILQKQYPQAQMILQPMFEKMNSYNWLSEDSITSERMRYENNRITYDFLGEKISDASMRGAATKKEDIDKMHSDQEQLKTNIDKYYIFSDESHRTMFFQRSVEKVKGDIDYALATVQKLTNSTDLQKLQQKMMEKDKKMADEIEKLQQQMNELNAE